MVMPPRYAVWGEIASPRAKFLQPEGLEFLGAATKFSRGWVGVSSEFPDESDGSRARAQDFVSFSGFQTVWDKCTALPPGSSRLLHLRCGEFFHCQAGAPTNRIFTGSDLELDFGRRLVRQCARCDELLITALILNRLRAHTVTYSLSMTHTYTHMHVCM